MWANAQHDGRRVINAAKFGWSPVLDCRAVTLRIGERKTWRTHSEFCTAAENLYSYGRPM